LLSLVLLAPLFALLALLVRLDSEGEVMFRQTRVGVDGPDFTIFKVLSMYRGAE